MSEQKPRRQFTKEFKLEALRLAERIGAPQAAEDLGIKSQDIYRWRAAAKKDGKEAFRGQGNRTEVEDELRRLRLEVKNLKAERDILKEATAFFARQHQ